MKKYIAKTHLSINVVDDKGRNIHVVFTPQTGGQSVFYTADETLQAALERHYRFGHLFRLDTSTPSTAATKTAVPTQATTETPTADDATETASNTPTIANVTVTDAGSAKDYLANTFGISRTKLKTITQIKEVAAANGVNFVGI